MLCELHSVAGSSAPDGPDVTPPDVDATAAGMTTAVTCLCLHRKRTLDTLRQRLSSRLKRARRHGLDVTDATSGDDVSDDADTSAGESLIFVRVNSFRQVFVGVQC